MNDSPYSGFIAESILGMIWTAMIARFYPRQLSDSGRLISPAERR
jgi:hypothetical protein